MYSASARTHCSCFNADSRWIPQAVQYGGPPETRKYCLVAAHGEVILHGGSVHFGNGMGMMGYTYLMTPVLSQPNLVTPSINTSYNRFDFNVNVLLIQ
ncbi:hypothetical protein KIN20_006929 [Parelaphostrongylus tenuis]|uniref:Uncharacterized protein n=1 Tax=Parelaphostrongylus tenuis TaxID=148309 RepID=A0AAD5QLF9_PARTN|nr:hypothetical protein KIN20_006929 [Parelaphostrongylus tenuis]